jgi:hypothetical protein
MEICLVRSLSVQLPVTLLRHSSAPAVLPLLAGFAVSAI